jgi:hypothetical protein
MYEYDAYWAGKKSGRMVQMIRKQVYIHPWQQGILKRLARTDGVSEVEIIRRTIDRAVISRAVSLNVDWRKAGPRSFLMG